MIRTAVLFLATLWAADLSAQTGRPSSTSAGPGYLLSFYGGAGPRAQTANEAGNLAFTAGAVASLAWAPYFFGLDVSTEGTAIVTETGKRDALEPAGSLNYLGGRTAQVNMGGPTLIGGGVLLGIRRARSYCPDSNLGFRCWAGFEPEVSHDLNLGLMGYATRNGHFLGARVTTVSYQILLGFTF